MLRNIPSSACALAIDGVLVRASVLGVAQQATAIDAYARKLATQTVERSIDTSRQREITAATDGFAAGYSQAIGGLITFVRDIDKIRTTLLGGVLAQARRVLVEHCASMEFNATWIERWCNLQAEAATSAIKVSVPASMPALFDCLQTLAVNDVEVVIGTVDCITLECGALIHEFLPDAAIFESEAMQAALDDSELEQKIRVKAESYAKKLIKGQ